MDPVSLEAIAQRTLVRSRHEPPTATGFHIDKTVSRNVVEPQWGSCVIDIHIPGCAARPRAMLLDRFAVVRLFTPTAFNNVAREGEILIAGGVISLTRKSRARSQIKSKVSTIGWQLACRVLC